MAFWMLAGHYSQHKRCSTHPVYLSKLTGDQKKNKVKHGAWVGQVKNKQKSNGTQTTKYTHHSAEK
jgi:hypothetical protein